MKAILIEEERFAEICDIMKGRALEMMNKPSQFLSADVPLDVWKEAVAEVHRAIHYKFVKWAQSHGASCLHH